MCNRFNFKKLLSTEKDRNRKRGRGRKMSNSKNKMLQGRGVKIILTAGRKWVILSKMTSQSVCQKRNLMFLLTKTR